MKVALYTRVSTEEEKKRGQLCPLRARVVSCFVCSGEAQMKKIILSIFLCLILTSCLAVGVPYSNDVHTLLNYSRQMHFDGRPFRMKELLDRAHPISQKKGDLFWLAEVYRGYGKYYRLHREETVLDRGPQVIMDTGQQKNLLNIS